MFKIAYAVMICKGTVGDKTCDRLIDTGVNKDDIRCYLYTGDKTLATLKNEAIKDAEKEYDFLFMLDDDILVNSKDIFNKYVDLMLKYQTGVVYYGYYGNINRVLHNIPNPAVKVKNNEEYQFLNRMTSDAVVGIDLKRTNIKFDENYNIMEFNDFLKRCYDFKVVPMNGFYYDVNESWKYFSYVDGEHLKKRNITKENLESDYKYVEAEKVKRTLVFDDDVTKILKHITDVGAM